MAPVSRRWGNHSILVKSVSARWALLSMKTEPKILSFRPEIPGFDPRIFGIESQCASNELLSASAGQNAAGNCYIFQNDSGIYVNLRGEACMQSP